MEELSEILQKQFSIEITKDKLKSMKRKLKLEL
jgi:hypothetical protein